MKMETDKMVKRSGDPYAELANRIILFAVDDYRNKLRFLKRKDDREEIISNSEEEMFFCSEWFNVLTVLDGKDIAKKLKKEVWGE